MGVKVIPAWELPLPESNRAPLMEVVDASPPSPSIETLAGGSGINASRSDDSHHGRPRSRPSDKSPLPAQRTGVGFFSRRFAAPSVREMTC